MLLVSHSACAEWFCERGVLTADATEPASPGYAQSCRKCRFQERSLSGNVELTFLGHPFERLGRALDPILAVVAVGRKQPDHLIGAAGGRTGDIAGGEIDGLPNGIFVLQRPLHHTKTPVALTVPLATD